MGFKFKRGGVDLSDFILKIKNYQNIREASLCFKPGLNVIVGSTSMGKTAIFRAVETALFNLAKPSHVTLGEQVSMVAIKYNGHTIVWKRDLTKASQVAYKVDGKVYTKIGRGQFELISKFLGIKETDVDDIKVRLNFQKQFSYPFLLDKTPSQLFKFIVDSTNKVNLMEAFDLMKRDMSDLVKSINSCEGSLDLIKANSIKAKENRDKFSQFLPYCKKVLDTETMVKLYEGISNIISDVENKKRLIFEDSCKLKVLNNMYSVAQIADNLDFNYVDGLNQLIDSLVLKSSKIEETNDLVEDLSQKLVVLKEVEPLSVEELSDLQERMDLVESIESQIKEVTDNLEDYSLLNLEVIDEIEVYLGKLYGLTSLVTILSGIRSEINELFSDIASVSSELEKVGFEISKFKVCPFCGSDLSLGGVCYE